MRSTLSKRYKMCLSIRDVLASNQVIVDSVIGLKNRVTEFHAKLEVLDAGTMHGTDRLKGHTVEKNLLRDRLAQNCFSIANAVWSHAADQNDEILKGRIPINISDFQYGKAVDQIGIFRSVMAEANALVKEIEAYGITAQLLTDTNNDLEEFSVKINSPKSARTANAVKTKGLISEFKEMDGVLEKLDRSVNALMSQHVELYNAYQKSRLLGTANVRTAKETPAAEESQPQQPVRQNALETALS